MLQIPKIVRHATCTVNMSNNYHHYIARGAALVLGALSTSGSMPITRCLYVHPDFRHGTLLITETQGRTVRRWFSTTLILSDR